MITYETTRDEISAHLAALGVETEALEDGGLLLLPDRIRVHRYVREDHNGWRWSTRSAGSAYKGEDGRLGTFDQLDELACGGAFFGQRGRQAARYAAAAVRRLPKTERPAARRKALVRIVREFVPRRHP